MTEIYLHFLCAHYRLSGNAPRRRDFRRQLLLAPAENFLRRPRQRWRLHAIIGLLLARQWTCVRDTIDTAAAAVTPPSGVGVAASLLPLLRLRVAEPAMALLLTPAGLPLCHPPGHVYGLFPDNP